MSKSPLLLTREKKNVEELPTTSQHSETASEGGFEKIEFVIRSFLAPF